jgi:hypothetical protein
MANDARSCLYVGLFGGSLYFGAGMSSYLPLNINAARHWIIRS